MVSQYAPRHAFLLSSRSVGAEVDFHGNRGFLCVCDTFAVFALWVLSSVGGTACKACRERLGLTGELLILTSVRCRTLAALTMRTAAVMAFALLHAVTLLHSL